MSDDTKGALIALALVAAIWIGALLAAQTELGM